MQRTLVQTLYQLLRGLLVAVLCSAGVAYATVDAYEFDSTEKEQTFNELAAELRCPQCQNNNIAESNATISNDMRAKVYELLQQDYSKQQVVDYMVARYGNFVTYDPPITPGTLVLWLAPLLALLAGAGVLIVRSRRSVQTDSVQEGDDAYVMEEPLQEPAAASSSHAGRSTAVSVWLCSALFLIGITVAISFKTGNWTKLNEQNRILQGLPTLKERATNGNDKLSAQETMLLAAGLRGEVASQPDNVSSWMLLGSVYNAMGDSNQAMQAFTRAYQQKPDDNLIKSIYAQRLLQSGRESDASKGAALIREVIKENPTDTRSLSALAMYAYGQKNYAEAIGMMEQLLRLLPKDSSRATVIEQSLERIKQEYEQQSQ